MINISVCIIIKNAKDTIKECLEALKGFDEIILLDNDSTDSTLEIVREISDTWICESSDIKNINLACDLTIKDSTTNLTSQTNCLNPSKPAEIRIFKSPFIGFGALKNLAVSKARNEWVFVVDSDEVIEQGIYDEIRTLDLNNKSIIYALERKNLYAGEWIKACGWSPDFVLRIFNKSFTCFNENLVHESVILPKDSTKCYLKTALKHYAYDDVAHLIDKMQIYSNLYAKQNIGKSSSPTKAFMHGTWSFIQNYFFKKGIFYGYKGFVISFCNALGTFFKYIKLYELNTAPPPRTYALCSLIITTYNQKERLSLVIDSVRDLQPLPIEVIIADDGSLQDTRDLIESYMHDFPCPLKHIWQEDKGFRLAKSRNSAIKVAKGDYIVIIDGDMILEKSFIKDHLNFAKKGVFLQGSRVILTKKETQKILRFCKLRKDSAYKIAFRKFNFKAWRWSFLAKFIYKKSKIKADIFEQSDFIKGVKGCNMSFFKSDFEAIGGFNEKFVGWGREDSEFVARFLFAGGEFRRLKFGAIAYHLYHDESPKASLESNHKLYLETIKNKSKFCKNPL